MLDAMALAEKSAGFLLVKLKELQGKKNQEWREKCMDDASKVAGAVAIALLSRAMGRLPLDDEFQKFMSELVDDPAAWARAHRLLGEVLKSPSRERRARLAAVFAAGPSICPEPGARDRLDALVERMFDDDIVALRQLVEVDSRDGLLIEEPHRQAAVSGRRRFCTAAAGVRPVHWDALPTLPAVVLDNLEALRLVREDGSFSEDAKLPSGEQLVFLQYSVTHLGRFLQASLQNEAIRAGMAVEEATTRP
jgi:hypothetical protein